MGIVVEEADETVFCLELLAETKVLPLEGAKALLQEANELISIFAASQRTAKQSSDRY
jgi:hypothetical protein